MALLRESYLRDIASKKVRADRRYVYGTESEQNSIQKSLLLESSANFSAGQQTFDIFLSHSFSDKEVVLGLKIELENYGYSVYVDWIDDYGLNRHNITRETVLWIQQRMRKSKCLLYATSEHASNSRWMPWETGFMDGYTGKVAIVPVLFQRDYSYTGTEFLGIYPRIEKAPLKNTDDYYLWVFDQANTDLYIRFDAWLNGEKPKRH